MSSHSQSDMNFSQSELEFYPFAQPLMGIPPPPIPKMFTFIPPLRSVSESESISSSIGESLNPDVPEFVPIVFSRLNEAQNENLENLENDISIGIEQNNKESDNTIVDDKSVNEERKELKEEQKDEVKKESSTSKEEDKGEVLVNGENEPQDVWKEVL